MATQSQYWPLQLLDESGKPPETRLSDPRAVYEIVEKAKQANSRRNYFDSIIQGMMSGNPPFSDNELRAAGMGWRANFATRTGEAFFNTALTQYWDIIHSAPQSAIVRTTTGNTADEIEDYSGIITEEFQSLNKNDSGLSYMFQRSQHDMVLYRFGPVCWMDKFDFRAKAVPHQNLYLPDDSKSCVDDWYLCVVRVPYSVHELYACIRNGAAAAKVGWNVKEVQRAIMAAVPQEAWQSKNQYDWMWYEQRMRNNDLFWGQFSETVWVSWVLWKEFPDANNADGAITQSAVVEDNAGSEFLFFSPRRFENWRQFINPFYYDLGDGTHHSVKGLGVKCCNQLAAYDRLKCNLVDFAFTGGPLHFQAPNASDLQEASVMHMGPFIYHLNRGTYIQTPPVPFDGPLRVSDDLLGTVIANLAQYRQGQNRKQGNPVTARQIDYEAENQSTIGRAQMARYLEQLNSFWSERYRRAANPNQSKSGPGGKEALAFQQRCFDRHVPKEALTKIEIVQATPTIGYGSADNRLQALSRMLSRMPLYNETGRQRLLEDITASDVGYSLMRRYCPDDNQLGLNEQEQQAEARQWVGLMKIGMPPQLVPSQNPMIYAMTFLQAAAQVVGTLQQGADPSQVYNFLEVAGPAILAHLQRLSQDPTRAEVFKQMQGQYQQLQKIHDQLGMQLKKQAEMQQQKQQQFVQRQQQLNSDTQLAQAELNAKMALKQQESEQRMGMKEQQTEQKMRLADLSTASKIRLNRATTRANIAHKETSKTTKEQ